MTLPRHEPRTSREALVAELLGDIDGLLMRVEALPQRITAAEIRLTAATSALDDASSRYRHAVNAFTGEAQAELTTFLQRKAAEVGSQLKAQHDAGSCATPSRRASGRPQDQMVVAQEAYARRSAAGRLGTRFLEHGVTAMLASMLTAALVLLLTG
jgi:hypothetical protein